jgi:hypothetical protein
VAEGGTACRPNPSPGSSPATAQYDLRKKKTAQYDRRECGRTRKSIGVLPSTVLSLCPRPPATASPPPRCTTPRRSGTSPSTSPSDASRSGSSTASGCRRTGGSASPASGPGSRQPSPPCPANYTPRSSPSSPKVTIRRPCPWQPFLPPVRRLQ